MISCLYGEGTGPTKCLVVFIDLCLKLNYQPLRLVVEKVPRRWAVALKGYGRGRFGDSTPRRKLDLRALRDTTFDRLYTSASCGWLWRWQESI